MSDDYTEWQRWNFECFIEHPEYGTCFLATYDNGNTEETRLYKMSDVQAEIDRFTAEETQ